jgi:molecular chaperone GrpE
MKKRDKEEEARAVTDQESLEQEETQNTGEEPVPEGGEAGASEDGSEASAPTPEQEIAELNRKLGEANDRFLRLYADFDNYRKRMQKEMSEARNNARNATVETFLTVFDHFMMAMEHADHNPDFQVLYQGMKLISSEFERTLESLGIQRVDAIGEEFDPNVHDAVSQEASDEVPAGRVLRQWKCGFRVGDRLIRPASVIVSSGPSAGTEAADSATE